MFLLNRKAPAVIESSGQRVLFKYALPFYYTFVATYTFLGTFVGDFAILVPFDFYSLVGDDKILVSLSIIVFSAFAYLIGWGVSNLFNKNNYQSQVNIATGINKIRQKRKFGMSNGVVYLNLISIIIYVIGFGPSALIQRNGYIDFSESIEGARIFLVFHYILLPISIFLLASIKQRKIRWFLLIVHALLMLASSTRLLGLTFVLYAIGRWWFINMKVNFRIIFNLLLGVYFSAWILSIRDNDSHGLVSNLLALFEKPLSVDLLFAGINYLTSFSVYGFALTMFPKEVDYYSFFISFSPLPLGFHDGERMIDSQTIIPGIPAPESAISIIYRTGILIVFVFYFSIGYLANNTSRKLPAKSFYSAMVLAIFLFAVLFSLQYNLRGFFRLLSSAWLIAVVAPSLKKYKIKL